MTRAEQTEALWRWIVEQWREWGWGLDISGDDLQDRAVDLGLLRLEKYDPAVHGEQDAEPGDDWYVPVPRP